MDAKVQQYIELLNIDLSKEITSIIMYRWQSVVVRGMMAPGLSQRLETISEDEIHHALGLADKIDYFGGFPTFQLECPILSSDPREIINENIRREEDAIATYKEHIQLFCDEPGVQWLLQEFMHDEEQHLIEFRMFEEESTTETTLSPNVMPLPSFMQTTPVLNDQSTMPDMGPDDELPATISVVPRVAAFADYLKRKNSREADLLMCALTNIS